MDANESINKPQTPSGAGWRLFNVLSKINTQTIALAILFILSLQPLFGIFDRTLFQYELVALYYGKTVLIRFLGYLGAANWFIDFYRRAYIYKKEAWKQTLLKRPWTGLLGVLLVWSFIAVFFAADKHLAFFGGPYRYEGFVSYAAYAGIFLNAALIRGEKQRKTLLVSVAAVSTALAVFAVLKEFSGTALLMYRNGLVGPFSATFINANHYGYYLCVSLMVIAGLYMTCKTLWAKITCAACFTLNLTVLLYNSTLGAYLALALGMVFYTVFCLIRKGFKKTWYIFILIAIFVILSFTVNGHQVINDFKLLTQQTGDVIDIIGSGGTETPEGQQAINSIGSARGKLWKNTVKVILANPVTGVGTDNIQLYISNEIPHNEYLQIAANLGFPGIIFYLAALVSCFAYAVKNLKKLSDCTLIAGMATLVYCVSAFVGISITVSTFQLFLFLGLLTGWFKQRDETALNEKIMARLGKKPEATPAGTGEPPKESEPVQN